MAQLDKFESSVHGNTQELRRSICPAARPRPDHHIVTGFRTDVYNRNLYIEGIGYTCRLSDMDSYADCSFRPKLQVQNGAHQRTAAACSPATPEM